jgi:hypothetical protein
MSDMHSRLDKAMTTEQFTQVVDAILAGKYSWACVLILRYAGYNPLHYIPYRTYNRLIKEHDLRRPKQGEQSSQPVVAYSHRSQSTLSEIDDLNYLELLNEEALPIKGGNRSFFEINRSLIEVIRHHLWV